MLHPGLLNYKSPVLVIIWFITTYAGLIIQTTVSVLYKARSKQYLAFLEAIVILL